MLQCRVLIPNLSLNTSSAKKNESGPNTVTPFEANPPRDRRLCRRAGPYLTQVTQPTNSPSIFYR